MLHLLISGVCLFPAKLVSSVCHFQVSPNSFLCAVVFLELLDPAFLCLPGFRFCQNCLFADFRFSGSTETEFPKFDGFRFCKNTFCQVQFFQTTVFRESLGCVFSLFTRTCIFENIDLGARRFWDLPRLAVFCFPRLDIFLFSLLGFLVVCGSSVSVTGNARSAFILLVCHTSSMCVLPQALDQWLRHSSFVVPRTACRRPNSCAAVCHWPLNGRLPRTLYLGAQQTSSQITNNTSVGHDRQCLKDTFLETLTKSRFLTAGLSEKTIFHSQTVGAETETTGTSSTTRAQNKCKFWQPVREDYLPLPNCRGGN